ncbi:FAD/NAD(P)-binding domain-containing protein [Amniculicola lignicola CBS 123094]|uniref:FAD/NAD(P)-binding domain-containing protein n=1 Tax=Amniculicola lignicola CBS 123094 TaxID=1392246 RepID=A0A6A5W8Q9_9PLEO|nr:FAD/NAD(P)-binding domain-containing protein [Amniculicola lignicola CBS 123094]
MLNPLSGALAPLAKLSLSSPHRVLIVGCAYGGISALLNLLKYVDGKTGPTVYAVPDFEGKKSKHGVEITVIDERDGYFYSVGAPLAHVTPKHTHLMWRQYSKLNELRNSNLSFKHGSVKKVDPKTKTADYVDRNGTLHQHSYDYVIIATGLKRHWPAVPKSGSKEEYLEDAKRLIEKITGKEGAQEGRRVVVIGAGAVGIEFSGEIKNYYPHLHVTLIHSRAEVLSSEPLPSEVKAKAKTLLEEAGVELLLGNRATVEDLPNGKYEISIADGTKITADVVLDATKKGYPTTRFLPAETLDDEREIKVTPHLTFSAPIPNASSHFGVGDVIAWSGIKRAGGAMVMGQLAAANVFGSILNSEDSSANFKLGVLPEYPAVIGLAVGKQCLTYDKGNGMKWGVQLMADYFQDDLGWAANLRYLGLTDVEENVEKRLEKVEMAEVGIAAEAIAA